MTVYLVMFVAIVDMLYIFFVKQKTAYEMRISDWSSDVCSSDLSAATAVPPIALPAAMARTVEAASDSLSVLVMDISLWKIGDAEDEIGRASCRERVCQYV